MNKAIEIWNSLDLSNQTNLECARAWFMEGFAHGQKVKTLTPTKAEIESGLSRVKWAELLIKQLPKEHEGRNSWLLNYGDKK